MDEIRPAPEAPPVAAPCCNLRHKGMYVYTDTGGSRPDHHGDYDSTIFWCIRSMKGFGPDDDLVDREGCCNPERACYEAS